MVGNQRQNRATLTQDRKERLETLDGWVWDVLTQQWEEGFKYLNLYANENGDALVPAMKLINTILNEKIKTIHGIMWLFFTLVDLISVFSFLSEVSIFFFAFFFTKFSDIQRYLLFFVGSNSITNSTLKISNFIQRILFMNL